MYMIFPCARVCMCLIFVVVLTGAILFSVRVALYSRMSPRCHSLPCIVVSRNWLDGSLIDAFFLLQPPPVEILWNLRHPRQLLVKGIRGQSCTKNSTRHATPWRASFLRARELAAPVSELQATLCLAQQFFVVLALVDGAEKEMQCDDGCDVSVGLYLFILVGTCLLAGFLLLWSVPQGYSK